MNLKEQRIFREGALDNYLRTEEGGEPLRVSPPWTWALFWTVGGILVLALALSVLGRVEVTTRGRGILKPLPGTQAITTQVGGAVARVHQTSGQRVHGGDVILSLDSATLQSQYLEADRQYQLLQSEFQAFAARMDRYYAEQESTLNARLGMLAQQEASQRESLGVFERKLNASKELEKAGLMATLEVDQAREALSQARRQLWGSQQNLVQTRQELAGMRSHREDDLWRREQDVQQARNKRDALQLSLRQTELTAPMDGVLEAMLVKPGDVIQPGAPVGRIVPQGVPLRVIAFLPEKDRAFVKPGDASRLELDQLPYAEFGTLKAKIVRISDDLATAQEFQDSMGDITKAEGPMFRVELDLEQESQARITRLPLRSGMLLNVRFTLRRQRPLSLLLDPLKRWLD